MAALAMLARGAGPGMVCKGAVVVDALKVGVGIASVIMEGLTALACLTIIEIALIVAHFMHQRRQPSEATDRVARTGNKNA
jgi:hypothetical protein